MKSFQQKEHVTRRSFKYTYYVSSAGESTRKHPALLFLHGFPDSAHLWSKVVASLGHLPNKIIIPDCLGYAGTDKPRDTHFYAFDAHADDLVDILDSENVKFTVIVGHDWGGGIAQRTYLHHPDLFSGVVLLNAAYMIPSDQPFDLVTVNQLTEKAFGYPRFSYWEFFTAPDAAEIIDSNLERMWQVMHGDVEQWMKKMFCVPDAMRNFLLGNEQVPLNTYAEQPEWKDRFMQQFKKDGFATALQMYKATVENIQMRSGSSIPKDRLKIGVPLLFITCTKDAVCVPEMMTPAKTKGLVPELKEVVLDCGHWCPMEKPDEIAAHLKAFLADINPS